MRMRSTMRALPLRGLARGSERVHLRDSVPRPAIGSRSDTVDELRFPAVTAAEPRVGHGHRDDIRRFRSHFQYSTFYRR